MVRTMKVLILTCDKNAWLLPKTFHFLTKFWPDCPYPVDIATGYGEIPEIRRPDREMSVFRADDAIWSNLLINYLESQSPAGRTLLLLEDYLLADKIDQNAISACLKIAEVEKAAFFRLNPCPGPNFGFMPKWCPPCLSVGEFDRNQPYLISTQPTILLNAFLLDILEIGESGWDVEIEGTKRAAEHPGLFLGTRTQTLMPVMNYLRRGEIEPGAKLEAEKKW